MEEKDKPPIRGKKLLISVSDDMHKNIKNRATDRGITITKWVIRAIKKAIEQEDKYDK